MTISIIIPTYNEAQYIARTVTYLRAHADMQVVEILIADGGSTDDTPRLARDAGAEVIHCPEKGRAHQMNYGASKSRGDLLYFVHADTLPPMTFVADILSACAEGHQLGNFCYRFDSRSRLLRFNAAFTTLPYMFCQGGDKTLFVRRELFFSLGGYDTYYVIMEEYDFLRRAKKVGHQWVVIHRPCLVSARKYEKNSWLRVQIANIVVFNLWSLGLAKPLTLKKIYARLLA
jgi:rSAM/selenodomain-associated transferase 2